MNKATKPRLNSYQIEEVNEEKINQSINQLDLDGDFSFWIESFANGNDENPETITDSTLKSALEETYKRTAIELYYLLKKSEEPITLAALMLLMSHLEEVYKEQIEEGPDFAEICDWDMQLAVTFELLSNFHSPNKALVGVEYIESEAIISSVLKENNQAAEARIGGIIDEVRVRFFQTTVDQSRQELFEGISIGLITEFADFRDVFNQPEQLLMHLIDDTTEYLEKKYENYADLLKNEAEIRKQLPQQLAHFNQLLLVNTGEMQKHLKELFQKSSTHTAESIWNNIITIAIESLEETDETEILKMPDLFAAPKSKQLLN